MCQFCDEYKLIRKKDVRNNDKLNCDPECGAERRSRYKISILRITEKRKRGTSKWYDAGKTNCKAYPLKFCPVCGRRL